MHHFTLSFVNVNMYGRDWCVCVRCWYVFGMCVCVCVCGVGMCVCLCGVGMCVCACVCVQE